MPWPLIAIACCVEDGLPMRSVTLPCETRTVEVENFSCVLLALMRFVDAAEASAATPSATAATRTAAIRILGASFGMCGVAPLVGGSFSRQTPLAGDPSPRVFEGLRGACLR